MKTLKIIVLAITVLLAGQAFAQNKGYNRIDVSYVKVWTGQSEENIIYDRNGVGFDYMHGISLSKKIPLFLEVGGIFILSYDKSEIDKFDKTALVSYITKFNSRFLTLGIPINLCYNLRINNKLEIIPFFGLYARAHIFAKTEIRVHKYSYGNFHSQDIREYDLLKSIDKNEKYIKLFNAGWTIGANVRYKPFIFGVNFGTGFIKTRENYTMCEFTVSAGFVL